MRDRNFIDEADEDEYDLGERRYHRREESIDSLDLEAWPRGIIKTVSVEVVEEVNPDHVPGGHNDRSHGGGGNFNTNKIPTRSASRSGDNSNRVSGASGMEQDWEAMLRNGPPGK
jgi:hypothetical protein